MKHILGILFHNHYIGSIEYNNMNLLRGNQWKMLEIKITNMSR